MSGYQSNIKHEKLVEEDGVEGGNGGDEYIDIELGRSPVQPSVESISMTESTTSTITANTPTSPLTTTSTASTTLTMVYAPHKDCGFKCGRCLRVCCDVEGSLMESRPCANDSSCRCTCLSTTEGGATASMFAGLITALLGVCCMGCEQCCRPRNQPPTTCDFCGWVLQLWQGILFVASWFIGISLALWTLVITMRLSKKYGTSCCRKFGCISCAKGFEDDPH